MAENGGWITLEDLREFPVPEVVPALRGTYRQWDVHTLPPPAGGWVVLQALNLLEQGGADLSRQRLTIWMAETLRASHGSRFDSPVRDLEDYEDRVRRRTSKEAARALTRDIPLPGTGDTTHFVVVDSDGIVVSVSQSLNSYFGAKVMCRSLGFLYNDYMREFETGGDTKHPFALRPAAMPYSS